MSGIKISGLGSTFFNGLWKTNVSYYLAALYTFSLSKRELGDFPGSPVVKTSPSNAGGAGLNPGQGAKIPHASWPKNQNIIQKQCCNKFKKDLRKKKSELGHLSEWCICFPPANMVALRDPCQIQQILICILIYFTR